MKFFVFILSFSGMMLFSCGNRQEANSSSEVSFPETITCEGKYPNHLQGICTNGKDVIYWSFTDMLVKTDFKGNTIKQIAVDNHHGDLCFANGRIFVAVNLNEFNNPEGHADSWVYEYDSETLSELKRYQLPEVIYGAGAIACDGTRFIVAGGLPEGRSENYLYEYDMQFAYKRTHVLPGYTLMGIQTIAYETDRWWFGCYGNPPRMLTTDDNFRRIGQREFDCALGITKLSSDYFYIAGGPCKDGCIGFLRLARYDEETGMRFVPES